MGRIIDSYTYSKNVIGSGLIIFCNDSIKKTTDSSISVNQLIANGLLKRKSKSKTIILESVLCEVLDSLPDNPVLRDIDILFNPKYKIDVIRLLVSVSKNKPFQVIWSGTVDGEKLLYSEPGYADYKTFDINSYDILCVI